MAEQVADIFTEVIIAPDFEPAALDILTRKKNQRLLRCAGPAGRAGRSTGGRSAAACCCSRLTPARSPATTRPAGS